MARFIPDSLFAPVDAGLCSFPAPLLAARSAQRRVEPLGRTLASPAHPEDEVRLVAADLLARAADSDITLDVAAIAAARAANQEYSDRVALLREMTEQAATGMLNAIAAFGDEAITDHLQPAMVKVWAQVLRAHGQFRQYGTTDGEMLKAPTAARNAWLSMIEFAVGYDALRASRRVLTGGNRNDRLDANDLFVEVRNVTHVWPECTTSVGFARDKRAPWETAPTRDRLIVMADIGAVPWVPTLKQQDEAWSETFAERVQQLKNSRAYVTAVREMFSG